MKKGIILTNDPGNDNKVSLEITSASSKIIPKLEDGKITMKIMIKEYGNLGDQSDSTDLTSPKILEALEKQKASLIKNEVLSAFKKAQLLDADVFGFGDIIYQKYPDKWRYLEDSWDETFKDISIDVVVEAKLRGSGKITKPITSD